MRDLNREQEEDPDPIFESSFSRQQDDDSEDDDDLSSNSEESNHSFDASSDNGIDHSGSDIENRAPNNLSPPKKFLGRLKDHYLEGEDFQSTDVEDKAMEWSAKLFDMKDRKRPLEDTMDDDADDDNDILDKLTGHEDMGPDGADFDGILEEAWNDVCTYKSREDEVGAEDCLGTDFLQGALVLHSDFLTNGQTGYNRSCLDSNSPEFDQSYQRELSSQDKMLHLNNLHIKYGAVGSRLTQNDPNPLEYRMKSTMAQRKLHLLFEFLAYYLPACYYHVSTTSTNVSQKRSAHPLLLALPYPSCSSKTHQWQLSLIRCNQADPRWQPPENLLHGFAIFYLMLMKHQVRLAEQKKQPRRQRIFLQRLLKALEDYPYEKTFDLLLEYATTLEALGALHRDHLRDYPQAFVYFTEALDTKSQLCGTEENADLASSLETLGVLARDKLPEQNEVAVRCLKQSLDMKYQVYFEGKDPTVHHRRRDREFLAEEYADVAQTLHSLGLAYEKSAKFEQAREYYEKSLTMKRKQQRSCQDTHREGAVADEKSRKQLIATLFNLGCVSEKLSYLEEARSYLEEALQLQYSCQKSGGGGKQSLMGTLTQIASIYEKCHEVEGSYKYYKAALDIHYQMKQQQLAETYQYGSQSNPLLPVMLYGAANVSNQLGHYEGSAFAYESLLDILVNSDSIQGRRLLIPTRYNLGLLNDVLGRIDEAKDHYRECLDMMSRSPDPSLKESNQAMTIRTNLLCLPDPFSDDAIPTIPVATSTNIHDAYHKAYEYYRDLMLSKYNHPEYVNQDAALAVTIRNLAMLSDAYARNFHNARDYYQQFLEVLWYPRRSNNKSHQAHHNARSTVAAQAFYALGKAERKERKYSNARHYQNEALELLVLTKKQRVQHSDTLTPQQVRVLAILHTAIEREIELLNSSCCLLWVRS